MLANTKIAIKITALVIMMSLVTVCVSIVASRLIRQADIDYSMLIEAEAKGVMQLARVNRDLARVGYGVYRTINYPGASTQAQDSAKFAVEAYADAKALTAAVTKSLPSSASTLADFDARLTEIEPLMKQAIERGLVDDTQGALAVAVEMDGMVESLGADLVSFNDELFATMDANSAALTDLSISWGWQMIAGSVLAAILGLVLALFVSAKGITSPLSRLRLRMADLAEGKLDGAIEGTARGDEVGQMAKTVEVFKANALRARVLEAEAAEARAHAETEAGRTEATRRRTEADQKQVVSKLASGLSAIAEGDLTRRLDQPFPDDYRQLQDDFNAAVAKLGEALGAVAGSVGGMKSQTDEISAAADDMSRRTEQQAAALEETAAALNEITDAVRKTADSARQAADVTSLARIGAEKSGAVVRQAVEAMGQIEASSDKIGKIIGVIDEIAFQTNLLALNAGVEAARAGEAGRGFAVVAQEVRGLAQRSAEAAKEIKELIFASSQQVGHGVELVGHTGVALDKMGEQVAELAALVDGIASSAKEQATGLNEVNTAINQMDQVTQQNAAMVEQSTAANRALAQEAVDLQGLMGQFRMPAASSRGGSNVTRIGKAGAKPSPRPSLARPVPASRSAGGSAQARKVEMAASQDSWEEF